MRVYSRCAQVLKHGAWVSLTDQAHAWLHSVPLTYVMRGTLCTCDTGRSVHLMQLLQGCCRTSVDLCSKAAGTPHVVSDSSRQAQLALL